MKVLMLYEYPALPAGLSTQGNLLHRGLQQLGVDVQAAHLESGLEKEWYYRWFRPDVVVGIGYWGYSPHIILHPQQHGMHAVPWLVADGYIANYRDVLNNLPLILVTSNWVRDVYARDGINPEHITVLPVGCDTDLFFPRDLTDQQVAEVRRALGITPDQLMLLTIGGDAASKGAQEVMKALSLIRDQVPDWKYVCKVWPQQRTTLQNTVDMELAEQLGIGDKLIFENGRISREFMPYLLAACDVYVGPSRLEGFGMPHVEAGASGKPVIAINAMAFRDTMVHGETAFLAGVQQENYVYETILGEESGYEPGHRITFNPPRIGDYRASVSDIAEYLRQLMGDAGLRRKMGEAGRKRAVECLDYRVVARQFIDIVAPHIPGQAVAPQGRAMMIA